MTTHWWQKHPRPVQLDRAALNDYMALDRPMTITSATALMPGHTGPSQQIITVLRRAARRSLSLALDVEESYLLVAEVLLAIGYQPPADGLVRWQTLLKYLADFQRWGEAGPDFDEAGLTEEIWKRMIRGELVAIAGRAL